jgi:hypothetical protein
MNNYQRSVNLKTSAFSLSMQRRQQLYLKLIVSISRTVEMSESGDAAEVAFLYIQASNV